MMLNLSLEELETLRRLQHSKEFEPYWVQITCILMLAHGHDAETISYDLGITRPACTTVQRPTGRVEFPN